MSVSDTFWSLRRLAEAWKQPSASTASHAAKPRRRTAVYTQQHIETIGGTTPAPTAPSLGTPRLPTELVVQIVLVAADEAAQQDAGAGALLELARVSRACHRAILATYLLPNVRLCGVAELRAFALGLQEDRLELRTLARLRVRSLTIRTQLGANGAPALFDASQAQLSFDQHTLPLLGRILVHLAALEALHLQGGPRRLGGSAAFRSVAMQLSELTCILGHYGGDVDRHFWLPERWGRLREVQLHGPQFRLAPQSAASLAALPQLQKLALVVPAMVSTSVAADDEVDASGRMNPLQILLDRCATLQKLVLVAHDERDYVGYAERYRLHLGALRRPRWIATAQTHPRVQLVTVYRRTTAQGKRLHPCEVSAWMMDRTQQRTHWFDHPSPTTAMEESGELEYVLEDFELVEPTTTSSSLATTSHGGSTPLLARPANALRTQPRPRRRELDPIDPADLLEDPSSDET